MKSLFMENVLDSATRVFQGTTGHLFLLTYLSKGPVEQQPLSDCVKSFKSLKPLGQLEKCGVIDLQPYYETQQHILQVTT